MRRFIALIAVAMLIGSTSASLARTHGHGTHPRRTPVHHPLANQNSRGFDKVANGQSSHVEAKQPYPEDHRQIRHEKHAMAAQNHGRIIRPEQRPLNQPGDDVSRQSRPE